MSLITAARLECGSCGKVIDGLNQVQAEHLMEQHQLSERDRTRRVVETRQSRMTKI